MSLEYILAGAAGLCILAFLAFVALLLAAFVASKLMGGRVVVSAPASDPLAEAAAKLMSVVDSGRLRGAAKVIDRLADHEGELFVGNVAAGVVPKASPPVK